jgi:hypothetical protein
MAAISIRRVPLFVDVVGHNAPAERPAAVVQAVRNFMNSVEDKT